jgi:hypothetical protein
MSLPNVLWRSAAPFAKAFYPAFAAVLVALVSWASTGQLSETELAVAVTGLLFAVVAYFVHNERLDPARKALFPAVLSFVGAIITWATTGEAEALRVALTGLLSAWLTYSVPNLPPRGVAPAGR